MIFKVNQELLATAAKCLLWFLAMKRWQKNVSSRHGGKTSISDVDKQLLRWQIDKRVIWTQRLSDEISWVVDTLCCAEISTFLYSNSGKLIYSNTVLLERTQLEYFHFIVLLPHYISERNSCRDRWRFCTKHSYITFFVTVQRMWLYVVTEFLLSLVLYSR